MNMDYLLDRYSECLVQFHNTPEEQRKMSTKLAKLQKKVLITQDTNLGKYVLKVIHDSITFVEDAAEEKNKNKCQFRQPKNEKKFSQRNYFNR